MIKILWVLFQLLKVRAFILYFEGILQIFHLPHPSISLNIVIGM